MTRLRIVGKQAAPEPEPKHPPIDIYAADKARIAAIDWSAVHVRSDRSRPVDLPENPRRNGLERRR